MDFKKIGNIATREGKIIKFSSAVNFAEQIFYLLKNKFQMK